MARPPVPTALKVLRGNPGKRPLTKNEPKPSLGAPGCPSWLSIEARAEWRRVVPRLDEIGMLTKVDRAALATYCETWATFVYAQRQVHEHGIVIMAVEKISDDGQVIYTRATKNPAIIVARDAANQIRQFCTEFGMTPSARTRLSLPEAEGDDAASSIFS